MLEPSRRHPDLVPERVVLGGVDLDVLRPRDPEALLSEEAFEHEEFLPYWAQLWPSAPALAEQLAERLRDRRRPTGDIARGGPRILELGCGLGLPGLVAARLGARVTATDWAPHALELLAVNAERNDAELDIRRLDWFSPGPTSPPRDATERWPLVIAADVLYEARNGPALLGVLDRVVTADGEAWIADPGRPPARAFWRDARAAWTIDVLGDPRSGEPEVRRLRRRTVGAR